MSTVLFGLATLDLTGAFRWPPGYTQAQHQAQMTELAQIKARLPRQV